MITNAIILIAWINFLNSTFWEGHIFEKIGARVELWGDWIYKPTIGCIICMTPWWGLLFWLVFDINPWSIVIAAGVNAIIVRFDRD